MMRIIIVVAFAIVSFSCNNKRTKTELTIFKAAPEGLEQSNRAISNSTNTYLASLAQKLNDPATAEVAAKWEPKAKAIHQKTKEILEYIEHVTGDLKEEAGDATRNGGMKQKGDDLDAVKVIFIDQKKGEELYKELIKYKQDVLSIDEGINKEFGESAVMTTLAFDLDSGKRKDFTQEFFADISATGALSILCKFKNNVHFLENQLIAYCHNHIGTSGWHLDVFAPLISQNSNQFKKGDKIKIAAGVGAYYSSAKPIININGETFKTNSFEGFANYESKTPLKAGKYSIPVKIEYTDYSGRQQVFASKVEYTVIE